jgi:DNA-binding XRE family transcriptional regulator
MSVQIRRLQPSVRIALPARSAPDRGRRYVVVARRRADFPPPTPQPTPCVLWQGSVDRDNYGRMKRQVRGRSETVRVTRWVMEQVLRRKLQPDEFILHACDNPPCFRVDHLSVGSVADNNADMRAKGRGTPPPLNRFQGECHPMAKLSAAQVRRIRSHWQSGLQQKTIAAMFDVSPQTISKICKGISWRPPTPDLLASAESGRLPPKRTMPVKSKSPDQEKEPT